MDHHHTKIPKRSVHVPHLGLVHDGDQPVADCHNDVPGPEAALVGGAILVDCPQHQVQTILIARMDKVMRQTSHGQKLCGNIQTQKLHHVT